MPIALTQPKYNYLTRVLVVIVACCLIALFTRQIWQGDFAIHLYISLGYGISALLCSRVTKWLLPHFHPLGLGLLNIVGTLLLGCINAAYWVLGGWQWQHLPTLIPGLLLALTITGALTFGFYFFEQKFRMQQALEIAKRQQAEQQQALLLAELKQLQSQIEPHFLFNTLANISALISLEPPKAQQLLQHLTSLLRRNLKTSRQTVATIADEIALLEDYLAIQQIRLGERLSYRFDVTPACRPLPFVPMLLQPVVENAVVHGIEPSTTGGEIVIRVSIEDAQLQISIADSGAGFSDNPTSKGNGVALANIRQRLATLFGNEAQFQLHEKQPHGVDARLTIALSSLNQLEANHASSH